MDPDKPVLRGRIKFWKDNGTGGIESDGAPGDVYVGLAAIDMPGYRALIQDELVEFSVRGAFARQLELPGDLGASAEIQGCPVGTATRPGAFG